MPTDYSQCWANCLGDCAGVMSQEHLVSECLYDTDIKVKGLPWCQSDWKFLKIGTLTSPILCQHHNHSLSEVDDGAKHTMNTIAQAFALWHVRKPIRARHWSKQYFSTNMLLFERWCLKTLININLNLKPGMPIQDGSISPTEELVRVAFGRDRFKPPMGLYMMVSDKPENRTIDLIEGEITVQTKSCNDQLSGAEFNMWGFSFLLNLYP